MQAQVLLCKTLLFKLVIALFMAAGCRLHNNRLVAKSWGAHAAPAGSGRAAAFAPCHGALGQEDKTPCVRCPAVDEPQLTAHAPMAPHSALPAAQSGKSAKCLPGSIRFSC